MKFFKELTKRIVEFLNPKPDIGGLDINDSAIRFVDFSGRTFKKASVILSPGIVTDGQVRNRAGLIEALKNLHGKLAKSKKKIINVIVTGSSSNIYTQVFNIPFLKEGKKIDEAVKLNLEMISPFDVKNAYYDAQQLAVKEGDRIEFLGAFTNASVIEQFKSVFKEANFNIVAFEFPALSLSRLVGQLSGVDSSGSHLILGIHGEGVNFLILIKEYLYFNHFISWRTMKEEQHVSNLDDIYNVIIKELKRLINFYGNRFNAPLDSLILFLPKPMGDLNKLIRDNFPLKVFLPSVSSFPDVSSEWFPALGAAFRGLIPRSEDKFISLAAVGTEESYFRNRVSHFAATWRNIVLAALGFLLVVFWMADGVLARTGKSAERELLGKLAEPDVQEVEALQNQARDFNRKIRLISFLEQKRIDWSKFLEYLNKAVGNSATIDRVYIDSLKRVILNGHTISETNAVELKNKILQDKNFDKVSLPLSFLQTNPDGSISFTLNFEIKSFSF